MARRKSETILQRHYKTYDNIILLTTLMSIHGTFSANFDKVCKIWVMFQTRHQSQNASHGLLLSVSEVKRVYGYNNITDVVGHMETMKNIDVMQIQRWFDTEQI
jgi:hypothetical protein